MLQLPYGRAPYPLDLGTREHLVLAPPAPPVVVRSRAEILDDALACPIGRSRLTTLARPGARVTVVVSDATRDEPRADLLAAVLRHLPEVRPTIAIATGTHGPADVHNLGLGDAPARFSIVNHDGHADRDLVELGTTSRGTPVRLHRCLVEADLVIATGCIRPHYFAGFGAGVKALFPGLGEARAIRINHALKTAPGSRTGIVEGNPCRADLEEAASLLPTLTFLLNGVGSTSTTIHAAVAGDPVTAFRAGVELARPYFTVRAHPAPVVIASDAPPVTDTLYQAAKIAAAVAPLVAADGLLVLVADCCAGTGPLDVVNEAILRIGVLPRLRPNVRIVLVSSLTADVVARTLVAHATSVADAISSSSTPILVVPRASQLIFEDDSV